MGWDRQIDYSSALRKLKAAYAEAKRLKERGAVAVLLVQLTNGCRVSEAIEALQLFQKLRRREVRVRVRKRRDGAERLIIIPTTLKVDEFVVPSLRYVEEVADRLGFGTTHSLRYAFITHLARKGVSPSVIAKISGHKKLDHILHYTETVAAEDILRGLVG